MILADFVNNVREKLIDEGFIGRRDLERDVTVLERSRGAGDIAHVFSAVGPRLAVRVNCRPDVRNRSLVRRTRGEITFPQCSLQLPKASRRGTVIPKRLKWSVGRPLNIFP
jgi:hypothetical protein